MALNADIRSDKLTEGDFEALLSRLNEEYGKTLTPKYLHLKGEA